MVETQNLSFVEGSQSGNFMTAEVQDLSYGRTLDDLGIKINSPEDRKDQGRVSYLDSVGEAVDSWSKDPSGQHVADFLVNAYGIRRTDMVSVLEEAGMMDYMNYKSEGRFIGMVASQVLKPTHYFLSNARALGELHKKGIPTAFMVMEYEDDKFHAGNGDKKSAFDRVDFIVGVNADNKGEMVYETVSIKLKPYAVKETDGTIRRVTNINDLNGYPCSHIYVELEEALGPGSNSARNYFTIESVEPSSGQGKKRQQVTTYPEAAFGFSFPGLVTKSEAQSQTTLDSSEESLLSLTDFYKILWKQTISYMRAVGDLPSEAEMPMFFVDAKQIYSTIAKYSKPPQETLDILEFGRSAREVLQNIFLFSDESIEEMRLFYKEHEYYPEEVTDEVILQRELEVRGLHFDDESGLLLNEDNMMDPASYYPFQKLWPDLYLECSSCGGDYFVGKVARAGDLVKAHHVPVKQIRLPDAELPVFEQYCIHPGFYLDLDPTDKYYNALLGRVSTGIKYKTADHGRDISHLINLQKQLGLRKRRALQKMLERGMDASEATRASDIFIPQEVGAFMNSIFCDVDQVIAKIRTQSYNETYEN